MPIGLVGTQTWHTGASGIAASVTLNYALNGGEAGYAASAPAVGDYAIITVVDASTTDRLASVTGFGMLGTRQYQNDTADVAKSVWAKFLTSSELTSFTITTGGTTAGTHSRSYHVRVYRGVDPTNPMDVALVQSGQINNGLPDPGSITPVTAGARVVALGGGAFAATGITAGFGQTGLSNFVSLAGGGSAAYSAGIGGGDVAWTSGAVNPAAWTHTRGVNTADSSAWTTLALRPAPSAPASSNLLDASTPVLESSDGTGSATWNSSTDLLQLTGTGASYGARAIWAIPTTLGKRYNFTGFLSGSSMNWRLGTTSGGSELILPETMDPGDRIFSFEGTGGTVYLTFNRQAATQSTMASAQLLETDLGARVKVWNGTQWLIRPPRVYDGANWVIRFPKVRRSDGTWK